MLKGLNVGELFPFQKQNIFFTVPASNVNYQLQFLDQINGSFVTN